MKRFDVYLRNKVTNITIYLHELPIRNEIGLLNRITLFSNACSLLLRKYIYPTKNRITLKSYISSVLKNVFEKNNNKMTLNSSVKAGSLSYSDAHNKTILYNGYTNTFVESFTNGKNEIILNSSPISIDLTSIIRVHSHMTMLSHLGDNWLVYKYPTMSHTNKLMNLLNESIVMYIPEIENDMRLNQSVNVVLLRYRLLEDMDDLTLDDFDNMSLEDVDFGEMA